MVSTAAVVGIALVALGLVLTPGPNMIYLVSRSISQGRRAGLVSLLGVAAGFGVYLAAAAAGLAAVFLAVPAAYTALKLVRDTEHDDDRSGRRRTALPRPRPRGLGAAGRKGGPGAHASILAPRGRADKGGRRGAPVPGPP